MTRDPNRRVHMSVFIIVLPPRLDFLVLPTSSSNVVVEAAIVITFSNEPATFQRRCGFNENSDKHQSIQSCSLTENVMQGVKKRELPAQSTRVLFTPSMVCLFSHCFLLEIFHFTKKPKSQDTNYKKSTKKIILLSLESLKIHHEVHLVHPYFASFCCSQI